MRKNILYLFLVQGSYYLLTGIWPFIHFTSYINETGWNENLWLSKMLAVFPLIIGMAFVAQAALRRRKNPALQFLALIAPVVFLVSDILSGLDGVLYLGDALLQLTFIGCWTMLYRRKRKYLVRRSQA